MRDPKLKLVFLTMAVIIIVTTGILLTSKNKQNYKPGISSQEDTAVNKAQLEYERRKEKGMDFSSGPCLTNDLLPGWVADIAHNPRLEVDNLPENQCSAYLEGRAKHFVELDPEGNVIKVQ